ncbi:MAG: Ig-like domain-containing protein, partial [Coriobacteriia bacterium]|nr:Ig-like domain-containing protein [Coriobacteriia bacterium]
MKSIKRFLMLGVLAAMTAFCLAPGFALADEGGVDITPTSFNDEGKYEITEAGTYNLTEDANGSIYIGNVKGELTINLNGHKLTNENTKNNVLYAYVQTNAVVTVNGAGEAGNNGTLEQAADGKNSAIRLESSGMTTFNLVDLNVNSQSSECLQSESGKSATLTNVNMSASGSANSLICVNQLSTAIESGTYIASDSMDKIFEIVAPTEKDKVLKALTANGGSFNMFPTGVTLGTDKTLYKEAGGDYKVVATDDQLLTKHCWKVTLKDQSQVLYSGDTKDIYFKNISEAEAFAGSKYAVEEINKSIEGAVVTLDPESCTYDGTPQKPSVKSIVLDGKTLAETDYTVAYGNNISAGTEAGTVIVSGANGAYTGYQTVLFEIKKASTTIEVAEPGDMTIGDEFKLNPTVSFDGAKITYESSDPKVASVSDDGTVKALAAGTTTIKVSVTDDYENHESATKDLQLTVKAAPSPTPVTTDLSAAKVTLSKASFTYNG